MRKRLICILLLCCMITALLPAVSYASTEILVDGENYNLNSAGLQSAIDTAADGDTVVLGGDIDLGTDGVTVTSESGESFILDLNGHTIIYSGSDVTYDIGVVTLSGSANLTVKDSGTGGTITSATSCKLLKNTGSGTLTLESGTIKGTSTVSNRCFGIANEGSGSLNITGGTVETTNTYALLLNEGSGDVAISGGTLSSSSWGVINHIGTSAKLTISGDCLIECKNSEQDVIRIIEEGASLEISGGRITGGVKIYAYCPVVVNGGDISSKFLARNTVIINGGYLRDGLQIGTPGVGIVNGGYIYSYTHSNNAYLGNGNNDVLKQYVMKLIDAAGNGVADKTVTAISADPSLDYTYGLSNVRTDSDGKLYVFLPNGITSFSVATDEATYSGPVDAVTHLRLTSQSPSAAVTSVPKETDAQSSVSFTLTTAPTGTWRVYADNTTPDPMVGVNAGVSGTTLTLTAFEGSIQAGDYYVAVTEANKNESSRLQLTVAEVPPIQLSVRMFNNYRDINGNAIGFQMEIFNASLIPVNLSDVKVRYYYTNDGEMANQFYCDSAAIHPASGGYTSITANVIASFAGMDPAADNADHYVEIGFNNASATLSPGDKATIMARIAKSDWSNFNQSNDYSFNPSATNYEESDKILLLHSGSILSGAAPIMPILTAGEVTRNGDTEATVRFTSNAAGVYYYEIVPHGTAAPVINTSAAGIACDAGETTITNPAGLSAGAKDIYIVVKSTTGNVSSSLRLDIPAYVPPEGGGSEGGTPTPTPTPLASSPTPTPAPAIIVAEVQSELFTDIEDIVVEADVASTFGQPVEVKISDNEASSDEVFKLVGAEDEVYPFDISIYARSSGEKVQPKEGHSVKITLPVPEKLLDSKENIQVVYVRDGKLVVLASQLIEKDGIWYITFEAVHFSPYALLVATPWTNPFSDVSESDWYYSAVKYAAQRGLMIGTGNHAFSPDLLTDRAMLVTILYKLSGSNEDLQTTFSDISPNAYYARAVAWAQKNGIIAGYGNGKFGPEDSITREQLAVILWRYAGSPAVDSEVLAGLKDDGEIAAYAEKAMAWAYHEGILPEKADDIIDPKGSVTRAETAAILEIFLRKEENESIR